jgi:hypothetical protein
VLILSGLYVIGGQQRGERPLRAGNKDWNGYEKGLILRVDPETRQTAVCVEYVSPPEVCAEHDAAVTFQASTIANDKLYTCTQTEVMVYTLPDFKQIAYVSLPCFNDVHHVRPTPEGNILVANAGLEMVMEISLAGDVLQVWNVLGEDPWGRFSLNSDYRGISTKPHRSHPNYIFYVDEELWVTRFHQGDALCLTNPEKRIVISSERIHDGVFHEGLIYFTSVNGHVIVANPRTLQVEHQIDLNSMHDEDALIGWCRSILVDHGKAWVGFSRIRPTKVRENVAWVLRGFKRSLPTHMACYDLNRRQCVAEVDLEAAGIAAVYSILAAKD